MLFEKIFQYRKILTPFLYLIPAVIIALMALTIDFAFRSDVILAYDKKEKLVFLQSIVVAILFWCASLSLINSAASRLGAYKKSMTILILSILTTLFWVHYFVHSKFSLRINYEALVFASSVRESGYEYILHTVDIIDLVIDAFEVWITLEQFI